MAIQIVVCICNVAIAYFLTFTYKIPTSGGLLTFEVNPYQGSIYFGGEIGSEIHFGWEAKRAFFK